MEIKLNSETGLVTVTDNEGNTIREHSVMGILLFEILEELKKLNSKK